MTAYDPLSPVPQRARLTVTDFLALAEQGAFESYARTELIEGEIWVVNAIHSRHARAQAVITVELGITLKASGAALTLYSSPSTELSEISLPEPDIVVARAAEGKLVSGPMVVLAVEVSDSTIDIDLGRKARLYARHAIPEYWVADLGARVIRQFWAPEGEAFTQQREVPFGETLAAATLPGIAIDTAGL